jgi:uncharacterized membrane protein YobD (UPF0266 family)
MKTFLTIIMGFGLIFSSLAGQTNDTATAEPSFYTRVFLFTPSSVSRLQLLLPPKEGESNQELLLRYFETQHVEIMKPATLVFEEKNKRLMIHATHDTLSKIEDLLSKNFSND